jgi:hypothetical protein
MFESQIFSEHYYVPVLNTIRDVVCRRPDSSVSRAAGRYSKGPSFDFRSGCTLKKKNLKNEGASIITHGEKKNLVSKVFQRSVGRELYFRETSDDSNNAELQSECKCCIALKSVHLISN